MGPYTQALLSAVPQPTPGRDKSRIILEGEVPSPMNPPTGCHFHPRCGLSRRLAADADSAEIVPITIDGQSQHVMRRCVDEAPQLMPDTQQPDHCAACWYSEQSATAN